AEALDPLQAPARPVLWVKWPNDLWLLDGEGGGRKLGGILIETVAAGNRRLAVIGIGINVQPMSPGDAATGYACVQEIDPQATAPQVLQRIAKPLVDAVRRFELEGFAAFAPDYARRDMLRDRAVRTTHPDVPDGVAVGLSDNGGLLVSTPEGIKEVTSGEVSVRLHPRGDAVS
ncbi:MAG TPA: biotin--[acetyl-CoA-carboxylase] ligase, partial [Albitalea sp.]